MLDALGGGCYSGSDQPASPSAEFTLRSAEGLRTGFVNGRYQVKEFLGEGGRKRVFLVHDSVLDRDVAFALIKTEGLDEAASQRVSREARAMGRLGDLCAIRGDEAQGTLLAGADLRRDGYAIGR